MNRKARTLCCSGDLLAKALMAHFERINFFCSHGLLNGFAFLSLDLLPCVADPFALVWLRWIIRPNISCHLADQLTINPLNFDLGILGNGDFDSLRDWKVDIV